MDRVDEWRTFAAVARLRSFSRAARELGVSPQAATRAVAALERRLGTRLLHRTTRAVSLAADGEAYLGRARRVLDALTELEAGPAPDAGPSGILRVAAPVLFGQLHVAPVVRELVAAHPAVSARLALADRIVSLADEGLDAAVRIGALPDSSLRALRLRDVRAVVVASPRYLAAAGTPRSPADLAAHACVAFTGLSPLVDRWTFGRRTVAVAARFAVDGAQAAIDAASAGEGLTRVLDYQVEHRVAAGELRIVLAAFEPPPRPVHVVWLPGAQSRAAAAFVELAARRLRRPRVTAGSRRSS